MVQAESQDRSRLALTLDSSKELRLRLLFLFKTPVRLIARSLTPLMPHARADERMGKNERGYSH